MESREIRERYIKFFENRGHRRIDSAPLVLASDPTTLFTSSGMQPLVPYLKGEMEHPKGKCLVNAQPCFRAEDIDEVGDNRHTTFFEMLGNWSLGDYFKKQQLPWFWEFLTQELGLAKDKLHVSIFAGNESVSKDMESYEIWRHLGVGEDHIHFYDAKNNWWSRSGPPETMAPGDIGGPDSEVFYDFGTPHFTRHGKQCHPNCPCGRFLEIGNSVFMQYQKVEGGRLEELSQKNVDFGGGLERLSAAVAGDPDIFNIDLFSGARKMLEEIDTAASHESRRGIRIILDHMRASLFLIAAGVGPANKTEGYVLRRLIRRAALHSKIANLNLNEWINSLLSELTSQYISVYPELSKNREKIANVITGELERFQITLDAGMKKILTRPRGRVISGTDLFDFYQTYGYPPELVKELAVKEGLEVDSAGFREAKEVHQKLSRSASAGMFKGGLASHGETETKYHTATHLLYQALRDVLGPMVLQKGSNITGERLRFDFSHPQALTREQIEKVEAIVNENIREDLPVIRSEMSVVEAKRLGALGVFTDRYQDMVRVYTIGDYSKEICGGPHVARTGEIGGIKIVKEEGISHGIRRIRAVLE